MIFKYYTLHPTPYALRTTHHAPRTTLPLWLGLALLSGLFYVALANWGSGSFGFPLDDAWIHQTYARNLARSGQLAFVPGVPSAGSTAPLWTFLLSLGYLLNIPFQIWTYALGILLLGLCSWSVARLGERLFPKQRWVGILAGLFCLFEWHLVWAAVSGMETLLFIWLSLLLVERYLAGEMVSKPAWLPDFGLGLIGGLLILTRPEGLGLLGLIGLDIGFRWWQATSASSSSLLTAIPSIFKRCLSLTLGLLLLLIPYMLFHWHTTGFLFPNTLYAKQAEYGVILQVFPLWWRLFGNIGPPVESVQGVFRVIFIGAQVLLLPGLIFAAYLTLKEQRFELGLIWLWWISYLLLYAFMLPVTYQHGRYQVPSLVWVLLLGVWGTACLIRLLLKRPKRRTTGYILLRAVGVAWVVSLVILLFSFTVVGAQAYSQDVRFIENEMVTTAKWLHQHTDSAALIATHDIGAIGYFVEAPLIDLAGLITPEVIPFIRDETALYQFVIRQKADYLVTFPSWYPQMTQHPDLTPLYTTPTPAMAEDNMTVYLIQP